MVCPCWPVVRPQTPSYLAISHAAGAGAGAGAGPGRKLAYCADSGTVSPYPLVGRCELCETVGSCRTKMSGETSRESPILPMPEGCRCGLEWHTPGDPEWFLWNYLTLCPVKPEDHTSVWRPAFKWMISSGSGGGIAPGGARLMIDDGKVSDLVSCTVAYSSLLFWRKLLLMCEHWLSGGIHRGRL